MQCQYIIIFKLSWRDVVCAYRIFSNQMSFCEKAKYISSYKKGEVEPTDRIDVILIIHDRDRKTLTINFAQTLFVQIDIISIMSPLRDNESSRKQWNLNASGIPYMKWQLWQSHVWSGNYDSLLIWEIAVPEEIRCVSKFKMRCVALRYACFSFAVAGIRACGAIQVL